MKTEAKGRVRVAIYPCDRIAIRGIIPYLGSHVKNVPASDTRSFANIRDKIGLRRNILRVAVKRPN